MNDTFKQQLATLLLHQIGGLSYGEVAFALGTEVSTVSRRVSQIEQRRDYPEWDDMLSRIVALGCTKLEDVALWIDIPDEATAQQTFLAHAAAFRIPGCRVSTAEGLNEAYIADFRGRVYGRVSKDTVVAWLYHGLIEPERTMYDDTVFIYVPTGVVSFDQHEKAIARVRKQPDLGEDHISAAQNVQTAILSGDGEHLAAVQKTIGSEMYSFLRDILMTQEKMEALERSRSWPARSGKLILKLALERLIPTKIGA